MDNIKEFIKEQLKKGFKIRENYYKNGTIKENLKYKARDFWDDSKIKNYEQNKKTFAAIEQEQAKIKEKMEIQENEINIILNNLKVCTWQILQKEGFKTLEKYYNKPIGEKTKEKIEEDLKSFFADNYSLYFNINLSLEGLSYQRAVLSFEIGEKFKIFHNNYYNKDYRIIENSLSIDNNTYSRKFELYIYYLNSPEECNRYEKIEDYTPYKEKYYKIINFSEGLEIVEDTNKQAKLIYKTRKTTAEKIRKCKKEIEELQANFNKTYAKGFLLNNDINNKNVDYI